MDQPSQKRVSKACDACKRRKVRCNGQMRCQQCAHLGLRCIYSPSSKQRSQGKRGHIISEFRNQTSNSPIISPPILPAHPGQGSYQTAYSPILPVVDRNVAESSMSPRSLEPQCGILLLTKRSFSRIFFHITIQQRIFSRSYPRLRRRCLSRASGYCRV